ncbi:hypothetical protein Tco_0302017, partial [Tanacetum coccineum]
MAISFELQTYFDMAPYLSGPNAKQVEKGMEAQFKSQYRNKKNKFKDEMFVERGGYKEPVKIRNFPPRGKSLKEWQELCDHFTSEKHVARSGRSRLSLPLKGVGHTPLADTR